MGMSDKQEKQQTLGSFWKPVARKYEIIWTTDEENGLLIAVKKGNQNPPNSDGTTKIAGFDLDHTLIKPKGKRRFSQHGGDWDFVFPEVPKRLNDLSQSGYTVVIFSNQNGLEGEDGEERKCFKDKINDFMAKLTITNLVLVAAMKRNVHRKPCTGMWHYYQEILLGNPKNILLEESFYVGDAAGRPKGWRPGAGQDFASSDRKFALNLGITFNTPEEFFLSSPSAPYSLGWSPSEFSVGEDEPYTFTPRERELVIFVGSPASGKTTFFSRQVKEHGYVWVNQDTLKSRAECLAHMAEALSRGSSIALDNTNPSAAGRKEYIELAKKAGYTVRCLWFHLEHEASVHLDTFRALTQQKERLPKNAFQMYIRSFEKPTVTEGFESIEQVQFIPQFTDEEEKRVFYQHLN